MRYVSLIEPDYINLFSSSKMVTPSRNYTVPRKREKLLLLRRALNNFQMYGVSFSIHEDPSSKQDDVSFQLCVKVISAQYRVCITWTRPKGDLVQRHPVKVCSLIQINGATIVMM